MKEFSLQRKISVLKSVQPPLWQPSDQGFLMFPRSWPFSFARSATCLSLSPLLCPSCQYFCPAARNPPETKDPDLPSLALPFPFSALLIAPCFEACKLVSHYFQCVIHRPQHQHPRMPYSSSFVRPRPRQIENLDGNISATKRATGNSMVTKQPRISRAY